MMVSPPPPPPLALSLYLPAHPPAAHHSTFSPDSVITWELFTREIPYSVSDAGLIRSVTAAIAHANLTPGIPSNMPLILTEICQSCWEADNIRPEFGALRMQLKQVATTPAHVPAKRGSRVTAAARSLFSSPKGAAGTTTAGGNSNNSTRPPKPQFNFSVTPKRRDGKSPKVLMEDETPLLASNNGAASGGDELLHGFASVLAARASAAAANGGGMAAYSNEATASDRTHASSASTLTTPQRQPGRSGDPTTPTRLITTDPAIHLPTPQRPRSGTILEARSAIALQPPPGYVAGGGGGGAAAGWGRGGNAGGSGSNGGSSPKRKSKLWAWLQKLKNLRRKTNTSTASREKAPTISTRKAPGFTTRTTIIEKPPGGWNDGGLGVQIEFDKEKQYLGATVSSIKPGSAADMAGRKRGKPSYRDSARGH